MTALFQTKRMTGTLIGLLVVFSLPPNHQGNQATPRAVQGTNAPAAMNNHALAIEIAAKYCMPMFEPSLDSKEMADFLLMPALLVQEALSDNIVLTYPSP